MGISNQLPNSRISQAGVIPNAAARPASPYEGQLVYQQDDNSLYTYDGSNWVKMVSASQPPAMELVRTETFTTSSNVPVDNCFSNQFNNYCLMIDISAATAAAFFRFQLTSNGAPSTSSYSSLGNYYDLSGGSQIATAVGTGNQGVSSGILGAFGTPTSTGGFVVNVFSPMIARATTVSWEGGANTTNTGFRWGSGGSIHYVDSSYNGIDLIPASGTIDGVVRVYGYRI